MLKNLHRIENRLAVFEELESRRILTAVPFAPAETLVAPNLNQPSGVLAEDLDNDGDAELLVQAVTTPIGSRFRRTGIHFLSRGNDGYQVVRTLQNLAQPIVADFNHDGLLDFGAIADERTPVVYLNPGDGDFRRGTALTVAENTRHLRVQSIQAADFDSDGDLDIILKVRGLPRDFRGFAWMENDGQGKFGLMQQLVEEEVYDAAGTAGDVDQDGDVDIVTLGRSTLIWYERLDNDFVRHDVASPVGSGYRTSLRAEDIDGDGRMDLDSIGNSGIWFENLDGKATDFVPRFVGEVFVGGPTSAIDINGDGLLDRVIAQDNLAVWLPNASTGYDLNNDGRFDRFDAYFLDEAIRSGNQNQDFDFNQDGQVNFYDFQTFVQRRLGSNLFDVNLDGLFNSSDMVLLFQAGKYEQDVDAFWAEGDFNGDNRFDSSDLVVAFALGYEDDPFDAD